MALDFIEELRWRGLLHQTTPDLAEHLSKGPAIGYGGFDPTASSLQIGNLVAIMLLVHFQRAGHRPIALIGGATAMIGDPSGKSAERNLLGVDEIRANEAKIRTQLEHFLAFEGVSNPAEIVNNHEWFGNMSLLDFLRDVGKQLTVSYMLAKDSVQIRLEGGLSFTEFSYQLLQGWDYHLLNQQKGCTVQVAGADQWGNITAGTEIVRKMSGNHVHAVTCPLVTKSDGTKFGKSAAGERIWLDPAMTSPYRFYQFWFNAGDPEAAKYIRIFTLLDKAAIEAIEAEHATAPHLRLLQKTLAEDVTIRVHSVAACESARKISNILFGNASIDDLRNLSKEEFVDFADGLPFHQVAKSTIGDGLSIIDVLSAAQTKEGLNPAYASKGEAKRALAANGVSINQAKVGIDRMITAEDFVIQGNYALLRKGKKDYSIIELAG